MLIIDILQLSAYVAQTCPNSMHLHLHPQQMAICSFLGLSHSSEYGHMLAA